MSNDSLTETCSCGAEFTYTGWSPMAAAKVWREHHRHDHAEPVASVIGIEGWTELLRLNMTPQQAIAAVARVQALCDRLEESPMRGRTHDGAPFPAVLSTDDVRRALETPMTTTEEQS